MSSLLYLKLVNHIDDIIVVYDEHWHEGVLGLMASRIKDHFQRPTIVLSQAEPGVLKGVCKIINRDSSSSFIDICACQSS